jgi:hypothetical protein
LDLIDMEQKSMGKNLRSLFSRKPSPTTTRPGKTQSRKGGTTSRPSPAQESTTESTKLARIKRGALWSRLLLPYMGASGNEVEVTSAFDFWEADRRLKEEAYDQFGQYIGPTNQGDTREQDGQKR